MGDSDIKMGVYWHPKTGELYFVDEVVDCTGTETGDCIGVSYHRLYQKGRRCVRTAIDFFREINLFTNRDNTASVGLKLTKRFILISELPPEAFEILSPGNRVYIPEGHEVEKCVFFGGIVYVCLKSHYGGYTTSDVAMPLNEYLNKFPRMLPIRI